MAALMQATAPGSGNFGADAVPTVHWEKAMHAAIVTGVSRGLGEALAAAMLARGFTVLGVGRTASPRLTGKRYHLAACDLAQPALARRRGHAGAARRSPRASPSR